MDRRCRLLVLPLLPAFLQPGFGLSAFCSSDSPISRWAAPACCRRLHVKYDMSRCCCRRSSLPIDPNPNLLGPPPLLLLFTLPLRTRTSCPRRGFLAPPSVYLKAPPTPRLGILPEVFGSKPSLSCHTNQTVHSPLTQYDSPHQLPPPNEH